MMRLRTWGARARRFFLKIVRGENVVCVAQAREVWDRQFTSGKWDFMLEAQPNREIIADVCAAHSRGASLKILDVGCGNGGLVGALEARGVRFLYTGIDFSKQALNQAKDLFPEREFVYVDVEHPPAFSHSFDIIVFSEILYYVRTSTVVPKYAPFLARDGIMVVSMYRTWRTWLTWILVRRVLKEQKRYHVARERNGNKTEWDIKVMTPLR